MPTGGRILTVLALAVLLLPNVARAEEPNFVMKVNVPFKFTLGDSKFSAGEYEFVRELPNLLLVRDQKGRVLTTALTRTIDAPVAPTINKVTFHKQGKTYVLSQVWLADRSTGHEIYHVLAPSRAVQTPITLPSWYLQWITDEPVRGFR